MDDINELAEQFAAGAMGAAGAPVGADISPTTVSPDAPGNAADMINLAQTARDGGQRSPLHVDGDAHQEPPAFAPPSPSPKVGVITAAANEFRITLDGRAIGRVLTPHEAPVVKSWMESVIAEGNG